MQDFSDWWNEQRASDEIAAWDREQHWIGYAQRIMAVMGEYQARTVIEVGCGAGYVGEELRRAGRLGYIGLDASTLMIQACRQKFPLVHYICADIRTYDDAIPADLVCSFSVLKHFSLKDWHVILKRVLDLGRYALVQSQIAPEPFDNGVEYHHTFVQHDDVLSVIENSGKRLIKVEENKTMSTGPHFFERTYLAGPA